MVPVEWLSCAGQLAMRGKTARQTEKFRREEAWGSQD